MGYSYIIYCCYIAMSTLCVCVCVKLFDTTIVLAYLNCKEISGYSSL